MPKKRTCEPRYTKYQSFLDRNAAAMAGVVEGDNTPMLRSLMRGQREARYEKKRRAYAKQSGIGARECWRRAERGARPNFLNPSAL